MIKLKYDFHVDLDLTKYFSGLSWMTKLIPFASGRAVAFGVGHNDGADILAERYWLAEIKRDEIVYRFLPQKMTEQLNALFNRTCETGSREMQIQAFKFGERFGVLIGSQFVYLFDDFHAEPRMIEIENHFTLFSEATFSASRKDSHFIPQRCGNPTDGLIPVVFTAPEDNLGGARHLSLLKIDEQAGKAKWLHIQGNGRPQSTKFVEYATFSKDGIGAVRLTASGNLVADKPPIIYDGAWIDKAWYLFIAGFDNVYPRSGISPSILTRNSIDLGLLAKIFQPADESLGHICASRDRLIVSPYRKNGSRKGKQSIYEFIGDIEHELTLPRGYTRFSLLEHYDDTYWLTTNPMGYNKERFDMVACRVCV